MSENERYVLEIYSDYVYLIDTLAEEIVERFSGPDRLLAAIGRLEARRAGTDIGRTWSVLADEDLKRRRLEAALTEARDAEELALHLLAEDARLLARATSLRERLEATLNGLSATETAQNAPGVPPATPEPAISLLKPVERGWKPFSWSVLADAPEEVADALIAEGLQSAKEALAEPDGKAMFKPGPY